MLIIILIYFVLFIITFFLKLKFLPKIYFDFQQECDNLFTKHKQAYNSP